MAATRREAAAPPAARETACFVWRCRGDLTVDDAIAADGADPGNLLGAW